MKKMIVKRISEILNETGAHIELEQLAKELGLTDFDCEILAERIEKSIKRELLNIDIPLPF